MNAETGKPVAGGPRDELAVAQRNVRRWMEATETYGTAVRRAIAGLLVAGEYVSLEPTKDDMEMVAEMTDWALSELQRARAAVEGDEA